MPDEAVLTSRGCSKRIARFAIKRLLTCGADLKRAQREGLAGRSVSQVVPASPTTTAAPAAPVSSGATLAAGTSSVSLISSTLRRPRVAIPAAIVLAISAAIVGVLYSRRAPALTERDTILLAEVANTTGDSVFDGTLTEALLVKLEESPFLNVAPEDRVQQTLT